MFRAKKEEETKGATWEQDYRKYTIPKSKFGNDSQTCIWELCSHESQWEYHSEGQPWEFRKYSAEATVVKVLSMCLP